MRSLRFVSHIWRIFIENWYEQKAHVITSDAEAIAIANELAAEFVKLLLWVR
ncbi:hypothetical protein [Nostoc sp. CCY 9925]|uniref:hypothetical protein n=1 Tax=Nostoc sp. CCY 9925 TaxID=3103865 RepID=UPI0039C5D08C